jgi:hypothetical protein
MKHRVIPAQAGTQHMKRGRRKATSFVCAVWVPAFAGMTIEVGAKPLLEPGGIGLWCEVRDYPAGRETVAGAVSAKNGIAAFSEEPSSQRNT